MPSQARTEARPLPGFDDEGLTRRQVIGTGVAVTMTILLGAHVGSSRAMASSSAPLSYLRRSSYAGLSGTSFGVGAADGRATALTLGAVGDVAGARTQGSLRGHEDAFVLALEGPVASALPQGTYDVRHDRLGSTALFLVPVGLTAGGRQSYEVVVDRSVGATDPPRAAEPPSQPAAEPSEGAREAPAPEEPAVPDPAPATEEPAPRAAPTVPERSAPGPALRRRRRPDRPDTRRRQPRRQRPAGRQQPLRRRPTSRS